MCNTSLTTLLQNNENWVKTSTENRPTFFEDTFSTHAPKYLWIGCSDARINPNDLVGLHHGELFIHRNVGNVVLIDDPNIQAVITYAVKFLKIHHIIVAGHYDCGAVKASLGDPLDSPAMEAWLQYIRSVRADNAHTLDTLQGVEKINTLCELNALEQARHVAQSPAVMDAWANDESVSIHTCVISVTEGKLKNLQQTITAPLS